ncbi:MAG: DUF342 domain-containing protein [Bacillota bacterium]
MADVKPSFFKIVFGRDKLTASVFALGSCEEINKEEIYRALKKEGITFGIKDQVIEVFSLCPTKEPMIIAEGKPPIPGKDGYMEILFGKEQSNTDNSDEEAVNFRETSSIISVDAGIQLVEVYPPVYGTWGIAVTGEPIEAPKPRIITIKAGKGVELNEEGNKAYAKVNGKPWIKEAGLTKVINVEPVYVHNSDVDIKTGNLRFRGDVKITGNVCEAMEVQVSGNIEVQGLVTMARVISGGKLIVYGNVISSRLRAGIVFPGAKKIGFMLSDINTELQNLSTALDQLRKLKVIDFETVDFGRVVLGLLDSRFKNIRPLVKNLQNFIGTKPGADIPAEIINTASALNCFSGLKPLSRDMYTNVVNMVAETLDLVKDDDEQAGNIFIRSALSSAIQSSGSVNVTGQGCVNTTITAGGNVLVRGSFKGGEILADGNVDINELGSNLGAPPVVRVAPGGNIKVRKAYEGSVIQVGKRRVTITREMDSFKARLNSDEQLEIF